MVVVSALFTGLQRLMGDVATMTVGWATVLLFGRVPQAQQRLLALVTVGSLVWLLALVCLGIPAIAGFMLSVIPRPTSSFDAWFQVVLLIIAIGLPLAIGLATVALEPSERGLPLVEHLVRSYPLAAMLGATTLFLVLLSLILKVRALQRGWQADHLPLIVKPGRYDAVAADLEAALKGAGLHVRRDRAPWVLTVPPKLIVAAGGGVARHLVPDELAEFRSRDDLWILLYPSDVALVGQKALVARARAAIAMRLTFAEVYLTSAKESEQIEDRLADLSESHHLSAADFRPVDELLASLVVPYDEWQTLYRLRLQVELQHMQAPA